MTRCKVCMQMSAQAAIIVQWVQHCVHVMRMRLCVHVHVHVNAHVHVHVCMCMCMACVRRKAL